MIPKIIHYCWFGRGKMPKMALKCIASWKKYLPDYTIKEWNEDNFDLSLYPYALEAYENRRYAFVSDVARLFALYTEGGIYMDTDVEVLGSLDPFLHHTAFSGFENETSVPTGIMASEKGGQWAKDILDAYNGRHFVLPDGKFDTTTNVIAITNYMVERGLKQDNTYQDFPALITIYPRDYFCPLVYGQKTTHFSNNTVAIHHFAGSWLPRTERFKRDHPTLMKWLHKIRLTLEGRSEE